MIIGMICLYLLNFYLFRFIFIYLLGIDLKNMVVDMCNFMFFIFMFVDILNWEGIKVFIFLVNGCLLILVMFCLEKVLFLLIKEFNVFIFLFIII